MEIKHMDIIPVPALLEQGWQEEKAQMLIRLQCSEDELNEALDAWLDAAIESDYSQHDAWEDWR